MTPSPQMAVFHRLLVTIQKDVPPMEMVDVYLSEQQPKLRVFLEFTNSLHCFSSNSHDNPFVSNCFPVMASVIPTVLFEERRIGRVSTPRRSIHFRDNAVSWCDRRIGQPWLIGHHHALLTVLCNG
jgi:hypothetical protein